MTASRIAFALAVASTVLFSVHYFLWARLVRDPSLPAPWSAAATTALAALGVSVIGGLVLTRLVSRSISTPVMWVVYTWLGLMFYLFLLTVAADVALLIVRVGRLAVLAVTGAPREAVDPERRVALARIVAGAVALAAVGVGGVGMANALGHIKVARVRVPLSKLPPGTPPYRIVQLSDLHLGPTLGEGFLSDVIARTNALAPDCVVITGDLVDSDTGVLGPVVARLADLRAKDGVFFVTGNHEYYSGVDAWLAFLRKLGVRVLRNERVAVGPIDLAGVDDWSAAHFGNGHGADIPRALADRDPTRPVVLLAHQPQAVVEAEANGVDLQLSGHTHGGQIFPWGYAVKLVTPYVAGLYRHRSAALYVSRGTGYWGPPMRVGAPAEITHLELAHG